MSAFPTTRWTLILAAKTSPEARREALAQLMQIYWRPLYVFFRKKGLDDAGAQDAVQELLVQVIERDAVTKVAPQKGRLRAYLRTMAGHVLINGHERQSAAKRGGPHAIAVTLDERVAASLADAEAESAEQAYDRVWAQSLMNQALEKLEEEFERGLRTGPFEVLAQFFGSGSTPPYKEAATQHGMSMPQLKAFVHRSRVRYRELVKEAVTDTVGESSEAEAELTVVLEALGR